MLNPIGSEKSYLDDNSTFMGPASRFDDTSMTQVPMMAPIGGVDDTKQFMSNRSANDIQRRSRNRFGSEMGGLMQSMN